MTTLSDEQFRLLLSTISGKTETAQSSTAQRNDPAALGPMQPCTMGTNKMTKLTKFEEWLEEAENRMAYIGNNDDASKVILLKTWGGIELMEFIKTHKIDTDQTAPNYTEMIKLIKEELRKLVNRTMAMHDLLTTKQGTIKWMDFIHELEKKVKILDFERQPYTDKDAVKDAAIFGMSDQRLREKALAEDPDLETLSRWGYAREAGKSDAHNLKDVAGGTVKRIGWNQEPDPNMDEDEIDDLIDSLKVMKLKKVGKYSSKFKKKEEGGSCTRCLTDHDPGRCPAYGKECFACGGKNHFARSAACRPKSTKRITTSGTDQRSYSETRTSSLNRGKDVQNTRKIVTVCKIKEPDTNDLWVPIKAGATTIQMFIDSGCDFTIIPPTCYQKQMGEIVENDTNLRAWGASELLNVKGMIITQLTTEQGAKTTSKVYIVDGFHPEPLLGSKDAADLGFLNINKKGRPPTEEEAKDIKHTRKIDSRSNDTIPQKIRNNLGITVNARPKDNDPTPETELNKVMETVQEYKGTVFDDHKVGNLKTKPIHLEYDGNYIPDQPRFRNVPIHYQPEVSKLLKFLREEEVITDVDPRDSYECIMNVVITDKKQGNIRMNIDNTPRNPGMKRTKYHVQTPQEIRHDLKEAKVFTEMDMGWAYHQIEIDEDSKNKAIFQTHEGIHRMERLYFGPTASSGIFHNEVRKAFSGLCGVTSIHDNILVWGKDYHEHYENLRKCLERCKEMGIILKLSKSTFCMNRVKWFGRIFSGNGVTADDDKIENIKEAGRPTSTEDVRSLLMACQFNAKFSFDNKRGTSYEEATAPLRRLLKKDVKFHWGENEEDAYKTLISIINDPATLQPFDTSRETHIMADSCEYGIQGSIYQVNPKDAKEMEWVPIDHASRALTPTEQNYSPLERESLAQSWIMEQFRFYIVGGTLTAWTDHEPLVQIYNNKHRTTSKRVSKHRDAIQDLQYEMKYIQGEKMPCDYGSRRPHQIDHLSSQEQQDLGFDNGEEIYVRRIINFTNSPDAVDTDTIKALSEKDTAYQDAKEHLARGSKPASSEYNRVWDQLCVVDGLILKENKIVIPDIDYKPGSPNIRERILDIAHDGHPGATTMKRYLRSRVWFPNMDEQVEKVTNGCLPCQASTVSKHRDPLVPTEPPDEVWTDLAADHWGPTPDGKYVLLVIDKLSRYPEVKIVSGTASEPNIEAFDDIFSRNGYCETLVTDGGPPFNGNESHQLQKYFKWAGIEHQVTDSAEDPEANGLAEAFMKHLTKIWHTALVEGLDPIAEANKHLQMVRATPHPTTGKSPAEMMFGRRKYRTRIPGCTIFDDSPLKIIEAQEHDRRVKKKQKASKDSKRYVKRHNLVPGDTVLLAQKKTKMNPPYDPDPYTVVVVRGHQVTATRIGKTITRDAQKWKKFVMREKPDYETLRRRGDELTTSSDDEAEFGEVAPMRRRLSRPAPLPQEHQDGQQEQPAQAAQGEAELPGNHEEETELRARRNPPRQRQPPARYR